MRGPESVEANQLEGAQSQQGEDLVTRIEKQQSLPDNGALPDPENTSRIVLSKTYPYTKKSDAIHDGKSDTIPTSEQKDTTVRRGWPAC